jgi:hypothetical protein
MTDDEFTELLKDTQPNPRVHVSDFDGRDRTLLLGQTRNDLTWHIYLKDGQIWRLIYRGNNLVTVEHQKSFLAENLVPDWRVFPEATDHQMAQRLQALGTDVPYLKFDVTRRDYYEEKEREGDTFMAWTHEDFK